MAAVQRIRVLTPLQHSAKGCRSTQKQTWAACRGSGADSSATQCYKGRCKKRKQHGQLCQRIRVLTPLQHSALQRNAEARSQHMEHARGSGADSLCNTVHLQGAARAQTQQHGSCVRGSGADLCKHCALQLTGAQDRTWQLCQRIRC
jgi:hypothetical protein